MTRSACYSRRSLSERRPSSAWPRPRRLALLLAWLAGVLLLLEGTTRVFFHVTGQDIEIWRHFTPTRQARLALTDPVLGWRLIPSAARNAHTSEFQLVYRTNAEGLRERELADDGRLRVLFLGDSQTFGEGVEVGRRFSDRVGEALGVFSINAGVPGWGLHQMVDWFTLDGWRLRPDIVVCVPIEGDLGRALYPVGGEGPPQVVKDPEEYAALPARFRGVAARVDEGLRRSYLYAFFAARARIALMRRRLAERDRAVWERIYSGGERGDQARHAPVRLEGGEGGRPISGRAHAADPSAPRERLMRETAARLLLRLRQATDAAGAGLLLAPIDDHPLPWLETWAGANGIAYADASPALRGQSGVRFRIDPHYNAKGHALLGEALAASIRARFDLTRRAPGPDASGRAWLEAEAERVRARAAGVLPHEAYNAAWQAVDVPSVMRPGEARPGRVRVTNAGASDWPAGSGRLRTVRLGWRWLSRDGRVLSDYGNARVELPGTLPPGAAAELEAPLEAPAQPGEHLLEFDLVFEGEAWFGARGSQTLRLPVRVR